MRARAYLALSCVATLAGCFGGGGNSGGGGVAGGDSEAAAAEALTRSVSFVGGTPKTGLLPASTATDVTLVPASGGAVGPGDTALMSFEVKQPPPAKSVGVSLVQFKGASKHFEVDGDSGGSGSGGGFDGSVPFDFDAGASSGSQITLRYSLADDVCDALCDRVFEISVLQAVRLGDGKVSRHATATIQLDCSERGDHSKCSGAATTRDAGPIGVKPGVDGVGQDFADAWQGMFAAMCACSGGTDATTCAYANDSSIHACFSSAADRFASQYPSQLDCVTTYMQEQKSCVESAACDGTLLSMCSFVSSSDSAVDPIEARCGATPTEVNDAFSKCIPGFDCGDGTTVDQSAVCDGFDDCSNGSDESCSITPVPELDAGAQAPRDASAGTAGGGGSSVFDAGADFGGCPAGWTCSPDDTYQMDLCIYGNIPPCAVCGDYASYGGYCDASNVVCIIPCVP